MTQSLLNFCDVSVMSEHDSVSCLLFPGMLFGLRS